MKVTFDSNVFQPVVRPDKFPRDAEAAALQAIHDALRSKRITGYVAETMADLEAIRRNDRAAYFSSAKLNVKIDETELVDGQIRLSLTAGPKANAHPGLHQILVDRFAEALALGFKFMRCPRIGLPRPQLVQESWFAPDLDDAARTRRQDDFSEAMRAIEARGVGREIATQLGYELATNNAASGTWFEGLAFAKTTQELKRVADAVGEWADGDAIAAHVAYGNDYFCTRDRAVSAGTSALNVANRAWLNAAYGVKFVTPAELAALL